MKPDKPVYKGMDNPFINPYFVAFVAVFVGPIAYGWWSKKAAFSAVIAELLSIGLILFFKGFFPQSFVLLLVLCHLIVVFYSFFMISFFHIYYDYKENNECYFRASKADLYFAVDTFFGLLGVEIAILSIGAFIMRYSYANMYYVIVIIFIVIGASIKWFSQQIIQDKFYARMKKEKDDA